MVKVGVGEGNLTRQELAVALGVHAITISKWQDQGMPVASRGGPGRPSYYNEAEVRAWMAKRDEDARGEKNGGLDPVQERAKKEHWQALIAEQTFLVREKKLLPADDVAKVWRGEVAAVRAIVLTSYTTHADAIFRAATMNGLAGVEAELKKIAYEVLNELGNPDRPLPEPAPDAGADEALAASAKRKPRAKREKKAAA